MAYGMEFGGDFGKLFLSVFRIIAVGGIGYYLWSLTKKKEDKLYIICIALIMFVASSSLMSWLRATVKALYLSVIVGCINYCLLTM